MLVMSYKKCLYTKMFGDKKKPQSDKALTRECHTLTKGQGKSQESLASVHTHRNWPKKNSLFPTSFFSSGWG